MYTCSFNNKRNSRRQQLLSDGRLFIFPSADVNNNNNNTHNTILRCTRVKRVLRYYHYCAHTTMYQSVYNLREIYVFFYLHNVVYIIIYYIM